MASSQIPEGAHVLPHPQIRRPCSACDQDLKLCGVFLTQFLSCTQGETIWWKIVIYDTYQMENKLFIVHVGTIVTN